MHSETSNDVSITLTSFFMKCVGFWLAADHVEQRRRQFATIYTVCAILFAVWVETRDFYYSWGNFGDCTYIACNILCLVMVLFKILILFLHKANFINLIVYTRDKFWQSSYDSNEKSIVAECKRTCTFFICFFTFFAQGTVMGYVITPIVANLGKNESDRILPFNMWLDLPLSFSPYFEITFIAQILSLYHVGVCYFCFDNFLCIMNIHVAGQFRILQYRMSNFCGIGREPSEDCVSVSPNYANECYDAFKNCIRQHQMLIDYCRKMEDIFTVIVLGQVLVFSLLMCLVGYQILLADSPPTRRLIFIFHITGSLCQLMMFTYSCDGIIEESGKVATAAYLGPWTTMPMAKAGRNLRKDLNMIIVRCRKSCCLTANGFFPVSLETYTAVLRTAMSYFTLLRQSSADIPQST